jgi:NitT/TauT family transport system substrate-binding protein
MRRAIAAMCAALLLLSLHACGAEAASPNVVRIGHFPNVTHVHGLVAHALSRKGQGPFEQQLGSGMTVQWFVFDSGPSAMEALLAGSLDATYVGPSPAINAHLRTGGDDVRVIAGATRGGAALVVREAAGIEAPADFRGRRIATPQFGNTQDVSCRAWLTEQGFKVTQTGGDVLVVPTANPDQLALFQRGELDAAWTVEPWVSRLVREGGGRVFVAEEDVVTTVFVASAALLTERPEVARHLATAHRGLTSWIAEHPDEAQLHAAAELQQLTGRAVAADLVADCWRRMQFADAVRTEDFTDFAHKAMAAGLLRGKTNLQRFVQTP